MNIRYDSSDFARFDRNRTQHNIMVLVGNGFDIAAIRKFPSERLPGKTTSYADFFEYVRYFQLCSENNKIFSRIDAARLGAASNWCDFEAMIDTIAKEIRSGAAGDYGYDELEADLLELQDAFTRFLNDIVTPDVSIRLNREAQKNHWAVRSFQRFPEDMKNRPDSFPPLGIEHYDILNFQIFNFNYTSLLDNYLYLDRGQFDPHIHKTVDTNAWITPDPQKNSGWTPSVYLITHIAHPNGVQNVPRSIIFGAEWPDYRKNNDEKKIIKSFWARNDIRYKRYFPETELFIIFGMALSKTDGWWMHNIFLRLAQADAGLILYFFDAGYTEEQVRARFFASCADYADVTDDLKKIAEKKICVVLMNGKNETEFLGFAELKQKTEAAADTGTDTEPETET